MQKLGGGSGNFYAQIYSIFCCILLVLLSPFQIASRLRNRARDINTDVTGDMWLSERSNGSAGASILLPVSSSAPVVGELQEVFALESHRPAFCVNMLETKPRNLLREPIRSERNQTKYLLRRSPPRQQKGQERWESERKDVHEDVPEVPAASASQGQRLFTSHDTRLQISRL